MLKSTPSIFPTEFNKLSNLKPAGYATESNEVGSAVTLYIYRVRWTYPARNPVFRSKSMKKPSCTRTLLDRSVPVGQATVP